MAGGLLFGRMLQEAILRFAKAVSALPVTYPTQAPHAWLVGGYVRDQLLGIESKDVDIEVYGVTPDALNELVRELFPGKVEAVGQSFGILKVFLGDGHELDIALPRRESKIEAGHKGFAIESDPTLDKQEAARRRDFTINAIMQDALTGEFFDPYHGREDLKAKILRVVDAVTFVEDPLRVYRALQMAARFELEVEGGTFALLGKMVSQGILEELSIERVTDEWKKMLLKAKEPSIGLELAKEIGIVGRFHPELLALESTPQEPEWHPEGNVWIHSLLVTDEAAKIIRQEVRGFDAEQKLTVMLAALCHDFGKPSTTKEMLKDGVMRLRSLGHEEAGEMPTRAFLQRFCFGARMEDAIVSIVKTHLQPGALYIQREKQNVTEEGYRNGVRKLLKKILPTPWTLLLAVSEADFRGRTLPQRFGPYPYGDLFTKTVQEHALDQAARTPLLQGSDIIARGIAPGPRVGALIAQIEALRDEGNIQTREEALAFFETLL